MNYGIYLTTPPKSYFKFKPALLVLAVAMSAFNSSYAATGDPLPGLTPSELAYFESGKERFEEVEFQRKKRLRLPANETTLGPRFNLDGCSGCHISPAVGGSSPPNNNPQVAVATKLGAKNTVPPFIKLDGPILEARFKFNPDGSRDGGVQSLFVISGRTDAGSCDIKQPDFKTAIEKKNISFRIPTPLFGAGLIEAITDKTILENKDANSRQKRELGISGRENRNPNDGTITRFGWKAQNKSLLLFSGEAYNVEQGITNELFPTERDETPSCVFHGSPEDHTFREETSPLAAMSDLEAFKDFMMFLAPPEPKPSTPESRRGQQLFSDIGCAACHTPQLKTGKSSTAALSEKPVNLFSDLLLHNMGDGLADNIVQGNAGPSEFRTAPLWGVGERTFLLHDGRTKDLRTAILMHADDRQGESNLNPPPPPSEASRVVRKFRDLSEADKNAIIAFLKTL